MGGCDMCSGCLWGVWGQHDFIHNTCCLYINQNPLKASVKNFQITSSDDPNETIMQFGRIKNVSTWTLLRPYNTTIKVHSKFWSDINRQIMAKLSFFTCPSIRTRRDNIILSINQFSKSLRWRSKKNFWYIFSL